MSLPRLHGKRILVTGATGFIGGRIVERLILEHQADVVALVHQFKNASRLSRFSLRMIGGDVADPAAVTQAAEGCDAIIHCALGSQGTPAQKRKVSVEGARNICNAAQKQKSRLVHLSTFSVYGETAPGPVDEKTPRNPGKDDYGNTKLEAERLVQQYQQQGVAATILQPTVVYGPWSFWSTFAIRQLASGIVALPDNGNGLCNAVYVDDVVDAIFLALGNATPVPGPYLISAPLPVTWRDFYMAHGADIPHAQVVDLDLNIGKDADAPSWIKHLVHTRTTPLMRMHFKGFVKEIPGVGRSYRAVKKMRAGGRDAKKDSPVLPGAQPQRELVMPLNNHLALLRSKTHLLTQAAQQSLDYQSRFTLQQGSALTRAWIKWAGLAPDS